MSAWLVWYATSMTGLGEHILYLDFDGVLHADEVAWLRKRGPVMENGCGKLFEHIEHLAAAIAPHPQVKLVLATTWVTMESFSRVRKRLPAQIAQRVIGATWHSQFKRDPKLADWWGDTVRYEAIEADVTRRHPKGWLAVDDDDTLWPQDKRQHLVHCGHKLGLGEANVRKALARGLLDLVEGRLDTYAAPGRGTRLACPAP